MLWPLYEDRAITQIAMQPTVLQLLDRLVAIMVSHGGMHGLAGCSCSIFSLQLDDGAEVPVSEGGCLDARRLSGTVDPVQGRRLSLVSRASLVLAVMVMIPLLLLLLQLLQLLLQQLELVDVLQLLDRLGPVIARVV